MSWKGKRKGKGKGKGKPVGRMNPLGAVLGC